METLCQGSSLADFEVCRTLWAFRVIGLVRRVDAAVAVSAPDLMDEGLGFVLPPE